MHGWLPVTVQVIAAVALIAAVSRRTGRWQLRWLPWALIVGGALAASAYWYVASQGLSDNPAPACAVGLDRSHRLRGGGPGGRLAQRAVVAARRLAGGAAAEPAVRRAGAEPVGRLLPHRADRMEPADRRAAARPDRPGHRDRDAAGSARSRRKAPWCRSTSSDAASGFRHRGELVYLPPAWFATNPPPQLPTVMMIGGEFNTPADWLRTGGAIKTLDDFAAAHHGNAPVLVFVDPGGAFNNDTECVNGSRGNAADHLTKDVVPYMVSHFGVSPDRSNWGIVGWSMGGTCAVDLAVMHPDMFSAFEDIAGDIGPNSGNKDADHRATVRRKRRRVGGVRPDDRHHQARPVHGGGRLVRRQRLDRDHPTRQERPGRRRELVVRARRSQRDRLRGGEPAGQARLAVRIARVRAPPCHGWPARSAHPTCRRPRCRLRREARRLNRPPRGDHDRLWPQTLRRWMFARHSNPWSAWTRWASAPLVLVPVWTRRRRDAALVAGWLAAQSGDLPEARRRSGLGHPGDPRRGTVGDQPAQGRRCNRHRR